MSELVQDLKFGWRTLWKNRGFTTVVLATLAVGIGGNTAIFSFIHGVLLRPLPYKDPDRIVRVLERHPEGSVNGISTLNYLDWKNDNTVFEFMAAQSGSVTTLTGGAEPIQLRSTRVSVEFFDIFGVRARIGRTFAAGEDELGRDHVVVISDGLWRTQFGADPQIVGREIQLNNEPFTVIGVLPAGTSFDRGYFQLWRPLAFKPGDRTRDFHWMWSYARIKPGVTLKEAQAAMDIIGARIAKDFPGSNKGWGIKVDAYSETIVSSLLRQALYVLMAAVGMVLLIGCVNVASLTLARGLAREREVALRAALGAGRWRLVRQFLTESVLLAVMGGVLGLAIGYATMVAFKAALPPWALPSEATVALDGTVLLFTLALSVLSGVLAGLIPALQAARPDLMHAMKEGAAGSGTGRARHRARNTLIVIEVALACILLTGAGLLIRSFFAIRQVDPGFNPTNVLVAGLQIPNERFADPAPLLNYLHQLTESVAAVPGVKDVALISAPPMRGWGYGMPFQIAGKTYVDPANRPSAFFKMGSASYFRTLGIKLIKGRTLTERDVKGSPPVTVINQEMVRKYFPNEEPIGKQILIQEIAFNKPGLGPEIPWEVVGVVANEKVGGLDNTTDSPGLYVTNDQSPQFGQAIVVRGEHDVTKLTKAVHAAIHAINKDQALNDPKTLEQMMEESMDGRQLQTTMLTVFAAVALLLSALGIYGVVSYSVVQRTREIGVRGALGASARDVVFLILRGGLIPVAIGLVLGVGGVFGLTKLIASMLFGVGKWDLATLVSVIGILFSVALLACYVPARRAARISPVEALRHE